MPRPPAPQKISFTHSSLTPPLENLLRGPCVPFYCLISNREGLGTSLEIMGLATIDPHHTAVKRLIMREKLQEHRTAFVLGRYQISLA